MQGLESTDYTEGFMTPCAQYRRGKARRFSVVAKDEQWRSFGAYPLCLLAEFKSQTFPVHV
jgi:hypothetical protein